MNTTQLFEVLKRELRAYLDPLDEDLLKRAYEFAKHAHKGQVRKSGEPYINHPLSAAIILANMKVDLPAIVTCILHDVPEDTKYTLEDIEKEFGAQVSDLVAGITKLSAVYYKDNMRDRQIDTLRRMFLVMAKDIRVVLVKLADRLHNMRTLGFVKPEKSLRIAKETMEIYSPLANLLGVWEIRQEMDDLCFQYIYAKEYEKIKRLVGIHRKSQKNYLTRVKNQTRTLMKNAHIDVTIEGRWKHLFSIYKKMSRAKKTTPGIYDVPAIRIIVGDIPKCYSALGLIHSKWKPKPGQFKDYIAVKKPNGYQSLHTTVFGPDGQLVEFQIRTLQMDLEAKYGVASQFIYERRGGSASVDIFLEKTPWIKKILKLQEKSNVEFLEDLKLNVLSDRVFVFTPDGDAIDMPQGSSPLDFAYKLSSKLGDKYAYAHINKEYKPMSYELQTGDIVEIYTDKKIKPKREWLHFVITDEAKEGIKKVFKKRTKAERRKLGEMTLDNIFAAMNRGNFKSRSLKTKLKVTQILGYKSVDELLLAVGSGEMTEQKITRIMLGNQNTIAEESTFILNRFFNYIFQTGHHKIMQIRLKLILEDRVGLLAEIFDVFAHHRINILKLTARDRSFLKKKSAIDYIDLEIHDINQLHRAMRSLENIDGVLKVEQNKKLQWVAFYGSLLLCIFAWMVHPFIISNIIKNGNIGEDSYATVFWLITALFLFSLFYFRKFAQPYAPHTAGRQRFAIFFNVTIFLIVGTLVSEMLSLQIMNLYLFTFIMLAFLITGFLWSSK